jgi:polygalacturonase
MHKLTVIKSRVMKLTARLIFLFSFVLFSWMSCAKDININSLGAKPDSISDNTAIIQSAIDQCYLAGGGRVIVPSGKYMTGSLNLRNNVHLHLESGAVLIGSVNPADYPKNDIALIFARGQKNISVTGYGRINGRGNSEVWQKGDNAEGRPKIIYFIDCQDVLVEGVTLTNAAFWVSDYRGCNYVNIKNVKIYSYGNHNNDGIDIDSRKVLVSDCIVETDDDALCFKSHAHDQPCENVAVTNCILASNCNAIKFGTASHGGFRNISVSNCVIKRPAEDQIRQWHKHIEGIDSGHTVISGIALESVDGGIMDQVKISDIIMDGVQTPIFIKLGDRRRYNKVPGQLKNVQINNIVARFQDFTYCFTCFD